jgi:Holliday junction DNA helicase RuvA
VARADKTALIRIPGVGNKKAERLLVELKGRLQVMPQAAAGAVGGQGMLADLHSALLNLGFAPAVAEKASRHALERAPDERDLARLVREALRSTTTRSVA